MVKDLEKKILALVSFYAKIKGIASNFVIEIVMKISTLRDICWVEDVPPDGVH